MDIYQLLKYKQKTTINYYISKNNILILFSFILNNLCRLHRHSKFNDHNYLDKYTNIYIYLIYLQ